MKNKITLDSALSDVDSALILVRTANKQLIELEYKLKQIRDQSRFTIIDGDK